MMRCVICDGPVGDRHGYMMELSHSSDEDRDFYVYLCDEHGDELKDRIKDAMRMDEGLETLVAYLDMAEHSLLCALSVSPDETTSKTISDWADNIGGMRQMLSMRNRP